MINNPNDNRKNKNKNNSLNDGTFFMGEMAVNPYGQEQAQINPVNPINQTNQTQNSYGNGINWGALENTVKNTVSKIADSQIPNLMKNIYTNSFNNSPYGNSNLYGNNIYEDVKLPSYYNKPIYQQQNYQNYNFSKFDVKDTQRRIKNSISALEDVIQNSDIMNDDVTSIRNNMRDNLSILCNDIEGISHRKSSLPKIPTVESMRDGEVIEQYRKGTVDNASDALMMLNKAQEALKKNFNSVNMDSPEYYNKLYDYVEKTDELKKMSNSARELFDLVLYSRPNAIDTVNRIRKQHNFSLPNYNGITGGAANINNKLAFENIYIPYENTAEDENSTVLQGHIQKSDDNIKEINYEIDNIEKQENITEEDIKEILEHEENLIKEICENCKELYNEEKPYINNYDFQKEVINKIEAAARINGKVEKTVLRKENISGKLKRKIRQISINLYNLYVSVSNKQKENIMREIYKLKISFDSARNDENNEKIETKGSKDSNQKWIMPCNGSILSEYGEQRSDHVHNGIDIAVPVGTPIKAIADGIVVVTGPSSGYGYWVGINHGLVNGIKVSSEYGHLSKWIVSNGQKVKKGQIIGYSGNTGYSHGPHLHLTIRHGNPGKGGGKAVNPWIYIDDGNINGYNKE